MDRSIHNITDHLIELKADRRQSTNPGRHLSDATLVDNTVISRNVGDARWGSNHKRSVRLAASGKAQEMEAPDPGPG